MNLQKQQLQVDGNKINQTPAQVVAQGSNDSYDATMSTQRATHLNGSRSKGSFTNNINS